jgi:hypothetical protein
LSNVDWTFEHRHLWARLVPKSGQADTVQGEVIRCVGKAADEAYRNGNINWESGFERLIRSLAATLDDAQTFTVEERQKIRAAAQAIITGFESPDLSGRNSPYYFLTEMAVRWCIAHPEPVPHPIDPTLRV